MPCSAGWCPLTSHLAGCQSAGVEFISIVAETLGGLAKDTIHIIWSFGEAIAQSVGPQDSTTYTKHLFHRVATALWRGNSTLWMHRLPTLPPTQWTVYCSVCVCELVMVFCFQKKKKFWCTIRVVKNHQQGSIYSDAKRSTFL